MRSAIDARETSGFGLSVGTGIALQAIFTPTEEVIDPLKIIDKLNLGTIDLFKVSWYTIIRNIIDSLSKDTRNRVLRGEGIKDIISVANEELMIIDGLCEDAGLDFRIIAPDYKELEKYFIFKKKDTLKKLTFELARNTIKFIDQEYNDMFDTVEKGNVLFLTNINFDMLNNTRNLTILESHSGKQLHRREFNKKYRAKEDTSFLPFYSNLLFLLGDKSDLLETIKGNKGNSNLRKITLELMIKNKVTPNTPYSRIQTILSRNNYLQDYIRSFKDPF